MGNQYIFGYSPEKRLLKIERIVPIPALVALTSGLLLESAKV